MTISDIWELIKKHFSDDDTSIDNSQSSKSTTIKQNIQTGNIHIDNSQNNGIDLRHAQFKNLQIGNIVPHDNQSNDFEQAHITKRFIASTIPFVIYCYILYRILKPALLQDTNLITKVNIIEIGIIKSIPFIMLSLIAFMGLDILRNYRQKPLGSCSWYYVLLSVLNIVGSYSILSQQQYFFDLFTPSSSQTLLQALYIPMAMLNFLAMIGLAGYWFHNILYGKYHFKHIDFKRAYNLALICNCLFGIMSVYLLNAI